MGVKCACVFEVCAFVGNMCVCELSVMCEVCVTSVSVQCVLVCVKCM